ncbi:class I adenylate-forming enzyme family protein [Roseobacter sp. CCS2]|uniref:class I adenylate-forming enzyme family protein n=1 Tax=Roseobacter sp. CCS2 TaxID=391593 RepID=UPI0000F3FBCF|nr:class I adenylate-forming enzyme family protein [Roseobacter sp. CCS2]EBA10883.1 benzoate-coenzyme A ligase, putative [Roseobacter sp. CCS2]
MLSLVQSDGFSPAPQPFNMAAYVLAHADRLSDKTALRIMGRDGSDSFDYRFVKRAVLGTATGLLSLVKPNQRVILQLGNTPEFPIAFLGAIAAGIIPVSLSSALSGHEYAEVVKTIQPALEIRSAGAPQTLRSALPFAALRRFWTLPQASFAYGDANRPAYIIYTSGTGGHPTPVVHAHRAIWARRMMWDGWYGLREDDRMMHAGAFNWTYTLGTGLMDPWSIGATALIPGPDIHPNQLPDLMKDHNATLFAAAPGVFRRLLRADMPDMPRLRHGLSAGEKMAASVRADWEQKTGTMMYEAFGMSECSTFISAAPDNPAPDGTAGFVQPGRTVALMGDDGPVPRGRVGTIAVHKSDPGLMLGYLDQPVETAARYQNDWFMTGDLASMDGRGAITYAGRADDMMNAGGHRVRPIEVEDALTAHPLIVEAAACAVQVRTGVHVIAGFYVAADVIDEGDLRACLAARLADYKMPRLLIARDALPRGANNKLLRKHLRAEWETTHGQA